MRIRIAPGTSTDDLLKALSDFFEEHREYSEIHDGTIYLNLSSPSDARCPENAVDYIVSDRTVEHEDQIQIRIFKKKLLSLCRRAIKLRQEGKDDTSKALKAAERYLKRSKNKGSSAEKWQKRVETLREKSNEDKKTLPILTELLESIDSGQNDCRLYASIYVQGSSSIMNCTGCLEFIQEEYRILFGKDDGCYCFFINPLDKPFSDEIIRKYPIRLVMSTYYSQDMDLG